MDASVEAVDGDIVLELKKFLVKDGENEISVGGPQNFICAFADTVGEGRGSNRGEAVIDLSTGEVPAPPATGIDILLDSDRCSMLYLILNLMLGMGHEETWLLL